MERLFFALPMPEYVAASLARLREDIRGFRWILPENYHLTLFFLGETDPETAKEIRKAVSTIEVVPFFLPISGIGHFPPRGDPSVLFAGVGNGHPHLFQLQHRLTDLLFNRGFDPGERAWNPHITLARCSGVSKEAVHQFEKKHADFETAPMKVDEFLLLSSEKRGTRRLFSVVESFPLKGG